MKKTPALLFICFAFFALAREFWLHPVKFLYRKNEKANIRFFYGGNFEGNNWVGNRSKINFLYLYQDNDKTDLSSDWQSYWASCTWGYE